MARASVGTVRYNKSKDLYEARIQQGFNDNGKPNVKTFYGKTPTEAQKKLDLYKAQILLLGEEERVKKITFSTYFHEWMELHKKRSLKPTSYDTLETNAKNHITPHIGMLQIGAITTNHLQKLLNNMVDEGYSLSMYKKVTQLLNSVFRKAVASGIIQKNPMDGVTRLKGDSDLFPDERKIIFMEAEDIEKFTAEAQRKYGNGKQVYRMGWGMILALHTGLRMGEILGLKWKNINLNDKELYVKDNLVQTKNRKEGATTKYTQADVSPKTKTSKRTVHLTPKAIAAIEELDKLYHYNADDYIFLTRDRKPYRERNLRRLLDNILKAAGTEVQNAGLHMLRHTFASNMWRAGVDIKTISAQLGHKDASFTLDTYVHVFGEQVTKSYGLMDSI